MSLVDADFEAVPAPDFIRGAFGFRVRQHEAVELQPVSHGLDHAGTQVIGKCFEHLPEGCSELLGGERERMIAFVVRAGERVGRGERLKLRDSPRDVWIVCHSYHVRECAGFLNLTITPYLNISYSSSPPSPFTASTFFTSSASFGS